MANKVLTVTEGKTVANRMILNLTLNLQGDITSVKEWIEMIDPGVVVRADIVRTTKFEDRQSWVAGVRDENNFNDDSTCKHYKRVDLKLNVPIEYDAIGHRVSPTGVLAKYIDELVHSYQYRRANKFNTEVPKIEDHEKQFAHWTPDTSLPYWAAESRDNAVLSMYQTENYIGKKLPDNGIRPVISQ